MYSHYDQHGYQNNLNVTLAIFIYGANEVLYKFLEWKL
jgi:hypothetical protein